jgi:hypothetical protein
MNIISVLVFVFIVIPILYWSIRLAWWLTRVAYICLAHSDLCGRPRLGAANWIECPSFLECRLLSQRRLRATRTQRELALLDF